MTSSPSIGKDCDISDKAIIGKNCIIGDNCIIGPDSVIHDNVEICEGAVIENNVTVGHPVGRYYADRGYKNPKTVIGRECVIRTNSVVYAGTVFGNRAMTGTNTIIRENCEFGEDTSIGTMVQVENNTNVGKRVNIETNAHITSNMVIEDDVFIGVGVVTTNDNKMLRRIDIKRGKKTTLKGPAIRRGVKIGSNTTILPAIEIGENSVISAGSVVRKNIPAGKIAAGIPALVIRDVPKEDWVEGQK